MGVEGSTVEVCAILVGQIERDVIVTISTIPDTAQGNKIE